jgi:c-di-GMP-related signal transduction protein
VKLDLESILKEWEEDCVVGEFELDKTSRNTPKLHAKYLQYLSITKLNLKRAEHDQHVLLKDKWLYYNGKMDQQTIESKGWAYDPFDGLKVMKSDMDRYYDSDPEIQKSEEKIAYLKTIIETVKEILDTLKWRHQTIKNIIDWRRLEAGG